MAARSVSLEELLAQSDWVRGLAVGLVRDEDLAGELVQNTWVAALEHPPRFERGEAGLRSWFARVMRNAARQRFRGEARRQVRERSAARPEVEPAEDVVARVALQQRVVAAVMALDEPYRSTVLQRYFDELPTERMAELAGVSPAAVRKRLSRALEMLRARLDEDFGGGRGAWCAVLARVALRGGNEVAAGSGFAAGLVTLGVVMGWKMKLAGAAALLAILGGSVWIARSGEVERDSQQARAGDPEVALPAPERPASPAPASAAPAAERIALEPAEAVHELSLSGRVLDRADAPLAGALVELYAHAGDTNEVRTSSATDAAGRFEIAIDDLGSSPLFARASAPGFLTSAAGPLEVEDEVVLRLIRATELFGRVLDADAGTPRAGARVALGAQGFALSDSAGRYRLRDVPVDVPVTLVVSCDGYVTRDVMARVAEPEPSELDLVLERGLALGLELFDRTSGAPITGAELRRHEHEVPFARTDALGRAELRIATGTELALHVSAPGYCSFRWIWGVQSLAGLAPDAPHRVPMLALAQVEGRVTDAEGRPVEGCRASCDESSTGLGLSDEEQLELGLPEYVRYDTPVDDGSPVSDAEGRYLLPLIPQSAPQVVRFLHAEYVQAKSAPIVLATPGERARVDAVLAKGASVSGRVLLNGEAWRGAVGWELAGEQGLARVAADGSYALANVPAGRVQLFLRSGRGERSRDQQLEIESCGSYVIDFVWEEARASISGRVTDAAGEALEGEFVQASCFVEQRFTSFRARTDGKGRYALDVAPDELYRVTAGSEFARCVRENVEPGSDGVDFALPALGTLRLQLVDAASGAPVRTLRSMMNVLSWRPAGARTFQTEHWNGAADGVDVDGRLELALPVGRVDLRLNLWEDGYARAELAGVAVITQADPEPLRVELARGVELELALRPATPGAEHALDGRLLFLLEESQRDALQGPFAELGGPSNHRINGIPVWLEDDALVNRMLALDEHQRAILRGLAPGRYVLRAIPDDLAFEPAVVELGGEPRSTVELIWMSR